MSYDKSTAGDSEKTTTQVELAEILQESTNLVTEAYDLGVMVVVKTDRGLPVEAFNTARSHGFDVYQVTKELGEKKGIVVTFKRESYMKEKTFDEN